MSIVRSIKETYYSANVTCVRIGVVMSIVSFIFGTVAASLWAVTCFVDGANLISERFCPTDDSGFREEVAERDEVGQNLSVDSR